MADIYLIVGKRFENHSDLDNLNQQLSLCGLIADMTEEEKEFTDQYTPQNIRRTSDPPGTQRFDYIRLKVDDSVSSIVVGRILAIGGSSAGICHQYWPVSADLERVGNTVQSLKKDLSDAQIYALYANPEDVRKVDQFP